MDFFSNSSCVLLVGEGNFSFSVSLYKQFKCKVIATDLECEQNLSSSTKNNINYLKSNGQSVILNFDATKLHENQLINSNCITDIIFNFPHAKCKKMKIGLNRDLLKDFFFSCNKFINSNRVKVHVTLCSGQSGIEEIESKSMKWSDSWQITEQASSSDFVLIKVTPFCFENYQPFGYRLKDKVFNIEHGKTFTFVKRESFPFNTDKLHEITKNHLFNKSPIKQLIEELRNNFEQLQLVCELDEDAIQFPFIKHDIVIKKEDENKLSKYFMEMKYDLNLNEDKIFVNGILIGNKNQQNIILHIEQLASVLLKISDSRILYSLYYQFDKFNEFSLYPQLHLHDISLWLNNNFTFEKLLKCAIDVYGFALKSIHLIDVYYDEYKEMSSKCYRLTCQSTDFPLSKHKCNQLQMILRNELQLRHNIMLR